MENNQTYRIVKVWTNICRFLLAVLFIFSGFVKAIDPLGTLYKFQDYAVALGVSDFFSDSVFYLFAVLLAIIEFCLGIYLFFGIRRRIAPRFVLLMMSVMTPLTFWLAVANPISDCGCFGDAVVLTNWETFWKNVVLLVAAVSLLKWRKNIFPLVSVRFDWLIALYTWVYIIGVISYSIWNLPVFDFRPYYIGAHIREGMEIPEGKEPTSYETRFILQKDGVEKEFSLEEYPDSTWTFVDSKTVVKKRGYEPPIRDFSMIRQDDGTDITDEVLDYEGYTFLLVAHQLETADNSSVDLINELYDYSLEYGYPFYCLTASSDIEIMKWQDYAGAEYPFVTMDGITLKTMIRSNPGVLLLKQGTVINKWSTNNIPDEYELTAPLEELSMGTIQQQNTSERVIWVLVWFVGPLFLICMIDVCWGRYSKRKMNQLSQERKSGN